MSKINLLKSSLVIVLILFAEISFSQSKKVQIEILDKRIDSLNNLLLLERSMNIEKTNQIRKLIVELSSSENQIKILDNKVKELNSDFEKITFESNSLKQEMQNQIILINDLRFQNILLGDSINKLIMNIQSHKVDAPIGQDSKERAKTMMVFSELTHDFGWIKEGDIKEYAFQFANNGNEPLIIEAVKSSNGSLSP